MKLPQLSLQPCNQIGNQLWDYLNNKLWGDWDDTLCNQLLDCLEDQLDVHAEDLLRNPLQKELVELQYYLGPEIK